MNLIDQAALTVFADLSQRCFDAAFDERFPENGSFTKSKIKGHQYWYYNGYDATTGQKTKKYVGPASDPAITRRAHEFNRIKIAFQGRTEAVRMLRTVGFPAPDAMTGALIERMAKAGLFRQRGVLVGTAAFQTYPGLVGARPDRHLQTGDIDLAQDYGISVAIGEAIDPVLEKFQSVDATFREIPHVSDKPYSRAFVNARGYKVEFLVAIRSSNERIGTATPTPALGGLAAQPLRFLDFLIKNPVRSVLLHGGGVAVTVPAPERYALHKMIVSIRRHDDPVAARDLGQAAFLIEAMASLRSVEFVAAWVEAWDGGAKWRACLLRAKSRLADVIRQQLELAIVSHSSNFDRTPDALGIRPSFPR